MTRDLATEFVEDNSKATTLWMATFSGLPFWPLEPRACDVRIVDIAHALSLLCRFGGHTRQFYSVAQHSVMISKLVPERDALWGLLHDAAEAYLGDWIRPLKKGTPMGVAFHDVEDRILRAVAERFCLDWTDEHPNAPTSVRHADEVLLFTEKRDLMNDETEWVGEREFGKLIETIHPWPPERARSAFLARFDALIRRKSATADRKA